MNRIVTRTQISTTLVMMALAGCGDAVTVTVSSGPALGDVWLSADVAGTQRTQTFGPQDTIYVKADLVDAAAGTSVVATLIAVDVDHPDVAANTQVGAVEQQFDGERNRMNFDFSNDGPLPAGQYQVDLSISGTQSTSLPFVVAAADMGDSSL